MMYIPRSTYRIQFNHTFGFESARKIAEYLNSLGISDIYASPILKAKKGSMHGYDIVDPNTINPELGTDEEYKLLCDEYKKYKMGWLQDIVPNHMAYNYENLMLVDLLENGMNSRYYNYFDIEWNHPYSRIRDKILAPFLGKFYQEALEDGELKLSYDKDGFSINYFENKLPIKIESYLNIISYRINILRNKLGRNNEDFIRFQGVLYVLKSLPSAEELEERYSQIKFIKGLLWEVYTTQQQIKVFIDENIKIFNGNPGNKESFNLLDDLLKEQHFRLSYWKVANEETNYRRFFNINELISLRMENEETFSRTHNLILKMVREGNITGLRIDHVDGLYDPARYLQVLKERTKNIYVVVEKILELSEDLPEKWNVEGTTGYEFMNYVNGIFCKRDNVKKFTNIYHNFIRQEMNYEELVREKKRMFIQSRMAGEVERLAFVVEEISSKDRYGIDITVHGLQRALEEILVFFPIYRTYISKENFAERDREYIIEVLNSVKKKKPLLVKEVSYIGELLNLEREERFNEEEKNKIYDFIMRFQQLTGPLMAKGFEDTTLYIFNRFISLNEVGGNPGKFGISLKEFHHFNTTRKEKWPYTLNTLSTHDTKRGEDVRAFLNVLSELPDEWNEKIKNWNKINRIFKKNVEGTNLPDRNEEYFLYQTIIGSYPLQGKTDESYVQRIKDYLVKASREAKMHSSWVNPNIEFENLYSNFAEKILEKREDNKFLEDLIQFHKKITHYGIFNSLSQSLIKITSPGVPDFYQGTELWNHSLVDPDNRQPVDYELRQKYLQEISELKDENLNKYLKQILDSRTDGRVKFFIVTKTLQSRNKHETLFNEGEYIPLHIEGKFKKNIIVFARKIENHVCITMAPRFLAGMIQEDQLPLGDIWEDTNLVYPFEKSSFINQHTKEEIIIENGIKIADILKDFPVALLINK